MRYSRPSKSVDRAPPQTVPRMTARNDSDSRMPLPRDSRCACMISGMAPYLAGTKNVLCNPMPKTAATTTYGPATANPFRPIQKPARATTVMTTSTAFHSTRALRLL